MSWPETLCLLGPVAFPHPPGDALCDTWLTPGQRLAHQGVIIVFLPFSPLAGMAFPVPSLGRFLGFRAGKTWSLVLSWDGAGGGEGGASHPGGGIRKEPRSCQELGTGWEQGTRSSGGGGLGRAAEERGISMGARRLAVGTREE